MRARYVVGTFGIGAILSWDMASLEPQLVNETQTAVPRVPAAVLAWEGSHRGVPNCPTEAFKHVVDGLHRLGG
jgi:hypothetical protein